MYFLIKLHPFQNNARNTNYLLYCLLTEQIVNSLVTSGVRQKKKKNWKLQSEKKMLGSNLIGFIICF